MEEVKTDFGTSVTVMRFVRKTVITGRQGCEFVGR
jgi:hypothetical protein